MAYFPHNRLVTILNLSRIYDFLTNIPHWWDFENGGVYACVG